MSYETFYLFGKKQSRGAFDDFFDIKKYENLKQAYDAADYVHCDFVKNESGEIFIQAYNVSKPDEKKYHRLNYQHCPAGLDGLDDSLACEMAATLFSEA